jgi:hypothetical protein
MTLDELRAAGVNTVVIGPEGTTVVFFPQHEAAAPVAASPSTPEQSGKADQAEPEPAKTDIFDVLASGVIPGAPTRDGLAGTPGTG